MAKIRLVHDPQYLLLEVLRFSLRTKWLKPKLDRFRLAEMEVLRIDTNVCLSKIPREVNMDV